MMILAIYGVFIVAFFGNLFTGYKLIPPEITLATEIIVYLLFVYSLAFKPKDSGGYDFHLGFLFCFFLIVASCSIMINHYYNLRPVMSLRLIFRFYFFYLALINISMDEKMLKKINMLLFSLFILQLPASLIKFFFYGMSELTIGTYASRGGGLTTVIPIVAIAYLSAYFALYKPKPIYIVLIVGFVGFGILGRKRALLFIYPVAFLGIYIFLFLRGTRVGLMKQLITIICVVVFSMGLFAFMLKYNRSFNVEGKVGGSIDTGYALKFAKDYTTRKTGQSATGRVATTLVAFNDLFRAGIGQLFLGFGPGCLTGSLLQDKGSYFDKRVVHTQRSYGRTGAVYIATEYGLMGLGIICFVFLVFIFISYRCYKLEEDPYWKAFAAGSVIFAIYEAFIFFCYSDLAVTDDTIVPVYYYAMSVMYIRQKRLKSLYLSTNVK